MVDQPESISAETADDYEALQAIAAEKVRSFWSFCSLWRRHELNTYP